MPTRRRRSTGLLVAGFFALPLLELYVMIQVGQVIGAGWTILLLIADSAAGAVLLRHQGSRAWIALREALTAGRMPARELADGILIVVGGALMLTPGFVTDVMGALAVLPMTRPVARRALTAFVTRRLVPVGMVGGFPSAGFGGSRGSGAQGSGAQGSRGPGAADPGRPASQDVISGEVVDDD